MAQLITGDTIVPRTYIPCGPACGSVSPAMMRRSGPTPDLLYKTPLLRCDRGTGNNAVARIHSTKFLGSQKAVSEQPHTPRQPAAVAIS
jgi:hypothetical protein